jgi:hypothetical protein
MTEYELRTALQASLGEEAVTADLVRRVLERMRAANIHLEYVRHLVASQQRGLEIRATVHEQGESVERTIELGPDLSGIRMRDIHPPRKPVEEERPRPPSSAWYPED